MNSAYSYRADPAVPDFPDDRPIIVFDGYCALCSGWARFVLRHDRRERYRLLAAQSPLGRALRCTCTMASIRRTTRPTS